MKRHRISSNGWVLLQLGAHPESNARPDEITQRRNSYMDIVQVTNVLL